MMVPSGTGRVSCEAELEPPSSEGAWVEAAGSASDGAVAAAPVWWAAR